MKSVTLGILVFVLIATAAAALIWKQRNTSDARRDRLVTQFVSCLPDSLDDARRREVEANLALFFRRADSGRVDPQDVDTILVRLEAVVDAGTIPGGDLLYLMAQVGYFTYKLDPERNLPGGEVDHPTLNPEAAMVQLSPDSLWWAEFREWKQKRFEETGDSVYAPGR